MTLSRILKASLILLVLWPILLWFAAWLGWQPLFLFLSVIAIIPALASFYALRLAQHAGRWVEAATRSGLVLCAGFNVAMLLLVVLSALGQQQGIHIVNVTLLFVMIAAVVTLSLVAHLNSKFAGAASQFVAGLGMISLFFMAVLPVGSWVPELSGAVVGQIRRAEDRLFWNVGTTQATYYVTVRETTQRECLGCRFDKVNRTVSLPNVDNDKAFGERVTIPSGRWFLAAGPSSSRIFKEGLDWVPVLAANDNNPRRGFAESRVLLVIKNDLHPDDPFTATMLPPVTKAPEDNNSALVPDQQPAPAPAVQTQQSIQDQAIPTPATPAPISGATVEYLRLFESGLNVPERGSRAYNARFVAGATRYINWEIGFAYPVTTQRVTFSLRALWYDAQGNLLREDTGFNFKVESGWTTSCHSYRFGSATFGGYWKPGNYRVAINYGTNQLAQQKFTVVESLESPKPLSTIKLTQVHLELGYRRFDIQLKKQDGWFDTGIPVTAGTALLVWSRNNRDRTVQAMIGDVVLFPQGTINHIRVYTSTDQDDLKKNAPEYEEQYIIMPPNVLRTLKIRILPDISDDGEYVVKVSTTKFQPNRTGPLTPSQEREEAELVKWDRR